MIYWNNIYWKIKSKSLDVFNKNKKDVNFLSNSNLDLEYIPFIYTRDGFCISGNYNGKFILKLDKFQFEFNSTESKKFTIDYLNGKMMVDNKIFYPDFNNVIKMEITTSKNTNLNNWTICPKKNPKFPTCYVKF